jgi:transposase
VATKTADQLDLQALHRVRERLVSQRTSIINQIRAFLLERGVAVRQGLAFCAPSWRASWLHPRMSCHLAWCGSSRTWLATGAGSTNESRVYRARSRLLLSSSL